LSELRNEELVICTPH